MAHPGDGMVCPACGQEQPEGFECVRCGIVFAKWEERRRRTVEGPRVRGWSRPVGRTVRLTRLLVALTCLGLCVLMYLNGVALRSFGPFVALVLFLGASLYLILTLRDRISFGRMAVEIGVLGLAALVLYGTLPEVFSLSRPLYPEAIHGPVPDAAREFLEKARSYQDAARRFLAIEEASDREQVAALRTVLDPATTLDPAFRELPAVDQSLLRGVWVGLRSLHPLFERVGERMDAEQGPARLLPEAVLREVSSQLERVEAEMAAAEMEIARREEALREGPGDR